MNKLFKAIVLLTALVLSISSCSRRPLWDIEEVGARIKVKVDWSKFVERPTGMTLMFFDDADKLTQLTTNDVDSVYVTLPEGHWRVYVFNQSVSEFGSLSFSGMDKFETPEAYVAEVVSSHWVNQMNTGAPNQRILCEPEDLGVDIGEFEISDKMVQQYTEFRSKVKAKSVSYTKADFYDSELDSVYETTAVVLHPKNVVSMLEVTAYFKGMQNLYSARASITGLAEGFYITQNRPNDTGITQILEDWTKYVDENDPTLGYVKLKSNISTFGLPGGYEDVEDFSKRDSTLNVFTMACLLRDLKTQIEIPFNVGHKFEVEKYEVGLGTQVTIAIRLVLKLEIGLDSPIVLPEVPPATGDNASGFDATVDDWEEGETVEIPM